MRIVLDTDVVVAAMRSPRGASASVIKYLDQGRGTLLLSVPLALEYEAVCQLTEHRLAAGLDAKEANIFVNGLIAMARSVETYFLWRPQLRDPGDEMVLETAVNGQADVLATFNRRDYGKAPNSFGIELLTPGDTLRRIQT
jgi:putative PIN family toxin of toxin-antitoxin system